MKVQIVEEGEFYAYREFVNSLIFDSITTLFIWMRLIDSKCKSSRNRKCTYCRKRIPAWTTHHFFSGRHEPSRRWINIRTHLECVDAYCNSLERLEEDTEHWENWHNEVFV